MDKAFMQVSISKASRKLRRRGSRGCAMRAGIKEMHVLDETHAVVHPTATSLVPGWLSYVLKKGEPLAETQTSGAEAP